MGVKISIVLVNNTAGSLVWLTLVGRRPLVSNPHSRSFTSLAWIRVLWSLEKNSTMSRRT